MSDGSLDLMKWEAGIPGKAGTAWENGLFKINLLFPEGIGFLCVLLLHSCIEAEHSLQESWILSRTRFFLDSGSSVMTSGRVRSYGRDVLFA
jgi:hypothetical protein